MEGEHTPTIIQLIRSTDLAVIQFKDSHIYSSYSNIFASVVGQDQSLSFTEPENCTSRSSPWDLQGRGRGASQQRVKDVEDAVQVLEDLKGVPDPMSSSLIEGRWQLIFTTTPGSALPIQRTFVGVDIFKVFQEVYLRTDGQRVSNIVRFSDAIGDLKLEVIDDLVSLKKKEEKGYDETLEGERQLVWASQPEGQKREATVANGLKGMQIVKKNGRLENLNDFSPGFRYHASGDLIKTMCQWTQDMILLADLNFPSTSKENIHWRCYTLTTRLGYQADQKLNTRKLQCLRSARSTLNA